MALAVTGNLGCHRQEGWLAGWLADWVSGWVGGWVAGRESAREHAVPTAHQFRLMSLGEFCPLAGYCFEIPRRGVCMEGCWGGVLGR